MNVRDAHWHSEAGRLMAYAADSESALRILFEEILPQGPKLEEEKIRQSYHDGGWEQVNHLYCGSPKQIRTMVEPFCRHLELLPGFKSFRVVRPDAGAVAPGVELFALYPGHVTRIVLWISKKKYFATGDKEFPRAGHFDETDPIKWSIP